MADITTKPIKSRSNDLVPNIAVHDPAKFASTITQNTNILLLSLFHSHEDSRLLTNVFNYSQNAHNLLVTTFTQAQVHEWAKWWKVLNGQYVGLVFVIDC